VILPFCLPVWAFEHETVHGLDGRPVPRPFPGVSVRGRRGRAPGDRADGGGGDGEGVEPEDPFAEEPALSSQLSLRMVAEYAYDLDGAIHRPGGSLLLDTSLRFGLESAWNVYVEPLRRE